jgi:hypothetical protein
VPALDDPADILSLFWPISRAILRDEDNNTRELHRLRSLITYQLLFGGRLVIRDSDYVNALAFRNAVLQTLTGSADDHSVFFRTALDEGLIRIAHRDGLSLAQLAEQMSDSARSPAVPARLYRPDTPDLDYLDCDCTSPNRQITYSVEHAAAYYARQIQTMLNDSLEPYIDDGFRRRAADRVAEHLATNQGLGWEFFRSDTGFWLRFTPAERDQHGHFIDYVLGQAPHTGYLPDTLGISPIYMHDVVDAIDIWRGRHRRPRELVDERTIQLGAGFSFSDYVEYLSVLPVPTISTLMGSDEGAAFRARCEGFSLQQNTLAEVQHAYTDYRRLIDAAILRQNRTLTATGAVANLRALVRNATDEMTGYGVDLIAQEVAGSVIPFWRLGLALFFRLVRGEWPDQRSERLTREATATDIATNLHRVQREGDKISQRLVADAPDVADRSVRFDVEADICVSGRP